MKSGAGLAVIQPGDVELARGLAGAVRGQVRFGRHDRGLYSTDASIYQVEPVGVVIPADVEDLVAAVRYCSERGVGMLPRGGGTSLAGQCVNRAVMLDTAPGLRRLVSVDVAGRTCVAEPGIPIDELNRLLNEQKTGLFFAADPATVAQATVGGCIGNNAAGSRSIRYGRTSENLATVEVLLASGERCWLGAGAGRRSNVALRLARGVMEICARHADQIRARFPKTVRRNAGYGLDLIVQQMDRGITAEDLDLSGLMCGSEGTLAITLGARLKLHPVPLGRGLAVVTFATLEEAIERVPAIVATKATAVELLDDVVLDAARGNNVARRYVELLPRLDGLEPKAVLYVEYSAEADVGEIASGFAQLKALCPNEAMETYTGAAEMGSAWALRRAAEPLLHGLAADKKPQTFVEDNAVPIEQLPRFVREFKAIVTKHGTRASYWAHASVGVLHVRPLVDVHDPKDRERMVAIAQEVADLARDCGGVMSGEHGDGRIRGPLLERFFGAELIGAFREVKMLFDPRNLLNPDNLVRPGPVDSIVERLRVLPEPKGREVHVPEVDTYYTYEDGHGFHGSVEMCNGAGLCRRMTTGTMCPSYRATLDERHATRGRGNALRLAITGQFNEDGTAGKPKWDDEETIKTLDLCLSCKACKSECPSNVDLARLKAEYTAQRYREKGAPLASKVFGHVRRLNRLGSIAPGVANFVNRLPPVRAVMNRVLGLAPKRSIPAFAPSLYKWFAKHKGSGPAPTSSTERPVVVLYADCFVTYNEPHIGAAAVRVLEACGYEVRLPKVGCCGRAMMSTGLLPAAIESADGVLSVLAAELADPRVKAIVVCEPSCLSAIKDDWLVLKLKTPLETRKKVAAASHLVEEFIDVAWESHPIKPAFAPPAGAEVVLHGHCHQKAMSSDATSARPLKRAAGERVTALPSGCCGMAGSFGYLAHRYDVSMKIGELSLFPPVRAAAADAVICAPGTSCRHQIQDGTGRHAIHPIEYLDRCLPASAPTAPAPKAP